MVHGPISWENNSRDEQLFQQLFLRYHQAIVYYACRWVELPDAEAITAVSFAKCWQFRHRFDDTQQVRHFLYMTTHKACMDHIPAHQYPAIDQEVIDRAQVEARVLEFSRLSGLSTQVVRNPKNSS